MERYTEKHYGENGYYLICSGNCETLNCGDCGILDKIVDRLAAYEDTGLEPCDYSAMAHALKQAERAREDLTEMIRQIGATGLDRLRELAQADREGRCVVLPCKPSDVTVYQLRSKKHARGIGVSPRHISCATVWSGGHYALKHQGQDDCLDRDFKKTWFLDKAEAQAALRREQE